VRLSDVQADALAFMYAHEFVEQAIDEAELHNPLAHDIEYPTKAPLSDKIIDRNEVAEKVVFVALADLSAQRKLVLTLHEPERLLGQRWLHRLARLLGYQRPVLMVRRDGSFPASPLNSALLEVFDGLLQPGSDFVSEARLPVRRLLKLLFKGRDEERDPYHDILQWVGNELADEGFYTDGTELLAGSVPYKEAHPDLERMKTVSGRVAELRQRLADFERKQPELYGALRQTVKDTMKELSVLYARRFTL